MSTSATSPRRVLVVAYYFPPMGLSGVQRVAKFVKYLPQHGWEPVVLTVRPGGYFAFDPSLERDVAHAEVHRTASPDPTRLFRRGEAVALPAEGTRSLFSKLSQAIFVPDNKIGWWLPAVLQGRQLLRTRRFDAILATAPPWTAALVGATLSRMSGIPLVTDFRDDWVGNPRHVYPTALHRRLHLTLERRVLSASRALTADNPYVLEQLSSRHRLVSEQQVAIPHGYDAEDFEQPPALPAAPNKLRLVYSGVFYHAQTPDVFLRALAHLLDERPTLRDRVEAWFVGMIPDASVELAGKLGLGENVHRAGYLPHDEAVRYLLSADVLWMTVGRQRNAKGISTGKLLEYLGTRKSILGLVPPGAARDVLTQYGASYLAPPDDEEAALAALRRLTADWEAGTLPSAHEPFAARHDRRRLAADLAEVLEDAL